MTHIFRLLCALGLLGAALLPCINVQAVAPAPAETAENIRLSLFDAQVAINDDAAGASQKLTQAQADYSASFATPIKKADPLSDARIQAGFGAAVEALADKNVSAFAAARAQIWTSILAGSYKTVESALENNDGQSAQRWLPVREFRTLTRFSRPNADATLAITGFAKGKTSRADALFSLRADLLDTYQARLNESLQDLTGANAEGFAMRRAELASAAEGYFHILAPAYENQRGAAAADTATAAFGNLQAAAVSGKDITASFENVSNLLHNFRAAPLSAAEQSRRAGQLLRFLSLVSVEYARGVKNGQVIRDLEIQEASTFHAGAYAAFSDLENLLDARNHAQTSQSKALFDSLGAQLNSTSKGINIATPEQIVAKVDALTGLLKQAMPAEWAKSSTQGDFDVITSMLDQMETATRSGQYDLAESARLEAYAVMETGPEAKLTAFAPQLKVQLEDLFWNGQGQNKGLAYLIKNRAALKDVQSTRAELNAVLGEAQATLGENSAPAAVATNAGLIVFREGLEAVLILASLMSSMKRSEERRYRKPMWVGALLAVLATVVTWLLAHDLLQSLARYGETLEAIVSLIALGVLLLILNWFFHKKYWTGWIASFHSKKKKLISGEAGLWLGLIVLGFTSVYREGFEIVLFLQALVLEAGLPVVLIGVGIAMLAVVLIGVVTFRLQVNLPYKNMLIITGVLVSSVLLQMVGNTAHVSQVIGWLSIHPIQGVTFPYWLGTWFGTYATWEGIGLQVLASAYVIGSYYLAEWLQRRKVKGEAAIQHSSGPETVNA